MKRIPLAIIVLFIAAFAAGCAAVAAPPVDIPAPVVGRISAGTPDSSGKSTITGSEGAVTPDTIVLVANDAATVGVMWRITDAIVPAAYAQSTPSICSEPGKACAVADAVGAFTLQVDAAVGNTISIVIIDETGREISERVTISIPSSTLSSLMTGCVGEPTTGKLVDMVNYVGLPIMLFEGKDDLNNLLVFGSGSSKTAVQIPGCYAKGLAFYMTGENELVITVISSLDQVLWSAIFDSDGLIGILEHVLDREPLAIAFADDPATPLIATRNPDSYTVDRISLIDGTSLGSFAVPPPAESGEFLTDAMGIHTIGPFADGGWLGALVTRGSDGSNNQSYVVFFDAQSYANLSLDNENKRFGEESMSSGILSSTARDIADVRFGIDTTSFYHDIVMFIADHGNQCAHALKLQRDAYTVSVTNDTMADLAMSKIFTSYDSFSDLISPSTPLSPRRAALGYGDSGMPVAYIVTDELSLWKIEDYPFGNSADREEYDLSGLGLLDPRAIAVDDFSMSLIVGDGMLGDALDISDYWGIISGI